jgi:O-acetyl-ADP-ribose deacetylase (regulator of RNase III)
MMEFTTGDLLAANAIALVNTVNCVGIMGRGVALQFKNAFPDNFKAYARACEAGDVRPGHMFVVETREITNPRYIINFPTKRHWRGKSRIEDIEAGLVDLRCVIIERQIKSIAMPPLGSGLGGLYWPDVKERIQKALGDLSDIKITVFEPFADPKDRPVNVSRNVPRMTAGRAALVVLVSRYLRSLLDPFVTLLELHKLMYFMQESGETLALKYKKAPYGPYAENLRHVLRLIDGHLISGYADGGDAPTKQIELVPGAVDEAQAFLDHHPDTLNRFDRVADVVRGFETPFGLELLSTVHWVSRELDTVAVDEVVEATYVWGDRKRQFSPKQIALALDVLREKGWVGASH